MSDDGEATVAQIIAGSQEHDVQSALYGVGGKPLLLVDNTNPDVTVAALRDLLAGSGLLYERSIPVRLVRDPLQDATIAHAVTADALVMLAHSVCRPYAIISGKGALPRLSSAGCPARCGHVSRLERRLEAVAT